MSVALAAPSASESPSAHADWLELLALASADLNSSFEELASALQLGGTLDALPGVDTADEEVDPRRERIEPLVASAFDELAERVSACGSSRYPFDVHRAYLQARSGWRRSTYIFLLLLSIFGKDAGPADLDGAHLFEEVAAVAAHSYMGGDQARAKAFKFGFPRRLAPAGFRPALDALCAQLQEGDGSKDALRVEHQQDAKLDIVTWLPFADTRAGKIMAFGQCATGRDWRDKLTELQPHVFCAQFMVQHPPVLPLRLFLCPHRIEADLWWEAAAKGGVLFDRCRLTLHASRLPATLRSECNRWTAHVIRTEAVG